MPLNPADYHISEKYGFVLENPLEVLPSYFEPWTRIAKIISELTVSKTTREVVDKMPVLDWRRLETYRQKRLAHLLLSHMASSYVWNKGDGDVPEVLPACLAVPFYGVSKALGLPPNVCYAGLGLSNYTFIDKNGPFVAENMRMLYDLPAGGEGSAWFCKVNVEVELVFARCIRDIVKALDGVGNDDEDQVTTSLYNISQVVWDMKTALARLHEKLTSYTFFHEMRPYFRGWGHPNQPLSQGLIYEGVSDQPIRTESNSGSQSLLMQTFDNLLGVDHTPEQVALIKKLRSSVVPDHQRFVDALGNQPRSLRSFVTESSNKNLQEAYDALLKAVVGFRSYHVQIVTKYILSPAARVKKESSMLFASVGKTSAGKDLEVMPLLKGLRENTKDSLTNH